MSSPVKFLNSMISSDRKYERHDFISIFISSHTQGHIYAANKTFHLNEKGWLGFAKGHLFFRGTSGSPDCSTGESMRFPLYRINTMTLKEEAKHQAPIPGE